LITLAVPALTWAQRGQRGSVSSVAPVAGSPAEARVLAVRAERARKHFQEAGVDTLVEVVVGDAHETSWRRTMTTTPLQILEDCQ